MEECHGREEAWKQVSYQSLGREREKEGRREREKEGRREREKEGRRERENEGRG